MNINEIIEFWYSDRIKAKWFNSTPELDNEIREKYLEIWEQAKANKLKQWQESAEGCLALVIILDQFPLNMFRGDARSFSTEKLAIEVSKKAVKLGFDKKLDKNMLAFLYMPPMHSENIDDQELSVALFEKAGLVENWKFAQHHRDIVKKFGRFPHRNTLLKRESSQDEIDYLNSEDAFKG